MKLKIVMLRDGHAISRETHFSFDPEKTPHEFLLPPVGDGNPTLSHTHLVARIDHCQRVLGDWLLCQVSAQLDHLMVGQWAPALIYAGQTDQPRGLVRFAREHDDWHWNEPEKEGKPGDRHVYGLLFTGTGTTA